MPTWETTADWDAAQSETGVHHEQPANTDFSTADTVEKGYPTSDENGTSLELYLPLDEDSGTTVYDASGNAPDGTLQNSPTRLSGTILNSGGYQFGATAGTHIVSDTTTFYPVQSTDAFSMSFWVRFNSASTGNYDHYLFEGDLLGGSATGDNYSINYDSNNCISYISSGGNTHGEGTQDLNDNTWHHIGFFHDQPNDHVAVYIDGTLEYEDTGYTDNVADQSNDVQWVLGGRPTNSSAIPGSVDEFRFYSRKLSPTEISNLYQAGL